MEACSGSPRSCFTVFVATFLSLSTLPWTSQGQTQPQVLLVTQPEPQYYVTKDQPANITCEAYGATSIAFICLGSPALPRSLTTYQGFDEGRASNLVRTTLRVRWEEVQGAKDAGVEEYWCQCTAQDQDRFISVSSRRAIVSLAFLEKTFQESPVSQIVAAGSQTLLTCTPPLGDPVPQVTWRKDGHKVKPGADDNVLVGLDGSLTVLKTRAEDAGDYHCVAKNMAARSQSLLATLLVEDMEEEDKMTTRIHKDTPKPRSQRAVKKPIFTEQPLTDVYITPNQPITVACAVQGAMRMTVRCNNQRIDPSRLVNQTDELQMRKELTITYAEVENYINTFKEKMFKCQCVAWYTDPSLERKWGSVLSDLGKIYLAFLSEEFEVQPQDTMAQVGTSASIECGAPLGYPPPTVFWMFEQQRLDPDTDSRYSVDEEDTLTINQVDSSDEGRYYCVAKNSMGTRRSNLGVLRVSEEPVGEEATPSTTSRPPATEHVPTFPSFIPDIPVFTHDLKDSYFLDENNEAVLVCTVVSADMLTYRCLGERLQENEQVIEVQTDRASGKRLLTATTIITDRELNSMQEGQDYSCQCVAWYIKGGAWHYNLSNIATISPAYIDSVFMYEPVGGQYYAGSSVEFACDPPGGQPTPKMIWQKDGQVLNVDADDNLEILSDGRLFIDRARPQDSGEYVCVAFNPAGRRSSSPAVLEIYGDVDATTPKGVTTTERGMDKTSTTTGPPDDFELSTTKTGRIIPFFTDTSSPTEMYIFNEEPATITCWAVEATGLIYVCNGKRVQADRELDAFKTVDPTTGYTLLTKSIMVYRSDVEEFTGPGDYKCHCRAYYPGDVPDDWQYVADLNTTVRLAYMDSQFEEEPVAQTVEVGVSTELACESPRGVPKPTVHWLKNGYRVKETNKIQVSPRGNLLFEEVAFADSGNYTCVAENIMGSRTSNTVPFNVVDPSSMTTPEAEGEGEPEPTGEGEEGGAEGEGEGETWDKVPKFLAEPDSKYYIIRSHPVTITCQAVGSEQISFNCNGESIPQSRVQYEEAEFEGYVDVMSASIDISRQEVENHNNQYGGNDFHCQCYAKYTDPTLAEAQYVTSAKGYVEVAFLKKMFVREPFNITVEEGQFLSLPCEPPQGNPMPEVYWTLNGQRVERPLPASDYSYNVGEASVADVGVYVCVATNEANSRKSRPGIVSLSVNGEIISGDQVTPQPEGEPGSPSTTSDYEETWTTELTPQQKCMQILQGCTAMGHQSRADGESASCQNAARFVECIERLQSECEGVVSAETMEASETSKQFVAKKCNIQFPTKGGICQELMTCQSRYSDQTVPNADAETMPMAILCEGIHSFLRCADDAVRSCKIPQDNPDTSLTDLAVWFEDYCQKVVDKSWVKECPSFSQCSLPIEQTTILNNFVQASLWCPYIEETMECTRQSASDCSAEDAEEDLTSLEALARDTCHIPGEPEVESENPDGEGDEEMNGGGGNESTGQSKGNGEEPEVEAENPDGEGDEEMNGGGGNESTGQSKGDGEGNAAERAGTARGSMLLTTPLILALIWLTWR